MFLHNYAEWQRALGISSPYVTGSATSVSCVETTLKNTSGSIPAAHYLTGVNAPYSFFDRSEWGVAIDKAYSLLDGLKFIVGDGTTEVSVDDYRLAGNKTSSFVSTALNVNVGVSETGHFTLVATWNGTNNGNTDITIKEIGLLKNLPVFTAGSIGNSQLGSITYIDFLIARHILEEPVTIGAGNTGTVTIKIEMF